jgi:hypothetical protein
MRVLGLTLVLVGALLFFSGCSIPHSSNVGRFAIIAFHQNSSIAIVFDTATGDFEARNVPLLSDPRDPSFEQQVKNETDKDGLH